MGRRPLVVRTYKPSSLAVCLTNSLPHSVTRSLVQSMAMSRTLNAEGSAMPSLSSQFELRAVRPDLARENIFLFSNSTCLSHLGYIPVATDVPHLTLGMASALKVLKNIYLDYYEVFKDVQKSVKAKPVRASLYGTSILLVLNLFRTNQDLRSYNGEIISACNRVGAVIEKSRNPVSNEFVQKVGELNCQGLLRQVDLGFSTLVYRDECRPELALFRYNCSYLKPSILEYLKERIVDFSLLGRWLILEQKMRDYDINDTEYDNFVSNQSEQLN